MYKLEASPQLEWWARSEALALYWNNEHIKLQITNIKYQINSEGETKIQNFKRFGH
jgi:hypothetical protein